MFTWQRSPYGDDFPSGQGEPFWDNSPWGDPWGNPWSSADDSGDNESSDNDDGGSCEMPGNGDGLIEAGKDLAGTGAAVATTGLVISQLDSPLLGPMDIVGGTVALAGGAMAVGGGASVVGGHVVNAAEVAIVGVMGGCDEA